MRKAKGRLAVTAMALAVVAIILAVFLLRKGGSSLDRWPNAASAGYSDRGLENVAAYAGKVGTTGIVVLVDGKVLWEYGDVEARGYIAGARTAVLAMLFGNPVARGTIPLDATLEDLGIDDRGGLLPVEKRATVEQLLNGRSGVYHPSAFLWDPATTPPRGSKEPGTYFFGHQWGALAACWVYEGLTGRNFYKAVQEDLAKPLGFRDYRWRRNQKYGQEHRSLFLIYDLYLSARDLARLGQLMLQRGTWNGQQLIPSDWIARITTVVTPRSALDTEADRGRPLGFGFYWWVWENPDPQGPYAGAYTTRGQYGQYLTVVPALNMVVAHQVRAGNFAPKASTSWEEYQGILDRLIAARCTGAGGACAVADRDLPDHAGVVSRPGAASATTW
jgi:CubicO group peptidase (beta-lactamase class C family)